MLASQEAARVFCALYVHHSHAFVKPQSAVRDGTRPSRRPAQVTQGPPPSACISTPDTMGISLLPVVFPDPSAPTHSCRVTVQGRHRRDEIPRCLFPFPCYLLLGGMAGLCIKHGSFPKEKITAVSWWTLRFPSWGRTDAVVSGFTAFSPRLIICPEKEYCSRRVDPVTFALCCPLPAHSRAWVTCGLPHAMSSRTVGVSQDCQDNHLPTSSKQAAICVQEVRLQPANKGILIPNSTTRQG